MIKRFDSMGSVAQQVSAAHRWAKRAKAAVTARHVEAYSHAAEPKNKLKSKSGISEGKHHKKHEAGESVKEKNAFLAAALREKAATEAAAAEAQEKAQKEAARAIKLQKANEEIEGQVMLLASVLQKLSDMDRQLAEYKTLFESIQEFSFIAASARCRAYRRMAQDRFAELGEIISTTTREANGIRRKLVAATRTSSLSARLAALAKAKEKDVSLIAAIGNASKIISANASNVETGIEGAALRDYARAHPDKFQQNFEKVQTAVSFATSVGASFTPPTHSWIVSLSNLMIEIAGRGGSELLVNRAVHKRVAGETQSDQMDDLDEDPAALARGVTKAWQSNLSLVKSTIGVFSGIIPLATAAMNLIFSTVEAVVEQQAKEAEKLVDRAKHNHAQTLKELNDQFPSLNRNLRQRVDAVREDFLASLKETLKQVALEGGDPASYLNQVITQTPDVQGSAISAGQTLYNQLLAMVMAAFPPSHAQLVTGTVLQNEFKKFDKISHELPAGITVAGAKVPHSPEQRRPDRVPLPFETFMGGRVVDYNPAADAGKGEGSDSTAANPDQVYIAVNFRSKKVWLYANKKDHTLIRYDRPSQEALTLDWSDREIHKDGYQVKGQQKVHGTWYRPFNHYYVFDTGSSYEFVHESTAIASAGSADKIGTALSHLRLNTIDWKPDN
ncbi:hypothetical protein [Streptomyces sp. NPDC047981]|uniref:hypothetical protein n=1 Tax=Streptomyces sp. NPDC047981 TaxID=3154610 RepID=UPI0034203D97